MTDEEGATVARGSTVLAGCTVAWLTEVNARLVGGTLEVAARFGIGERVVGGMVTVEKTQDRVDAVKQQFFANRPIHAVSFGTVLFDTILRLLAKGNSGRFRWDGENHSASFCEFFPFFVFFDPASM